MRIDGLYQINFTIKEVTILHTLITMVVDNNGFGRGITGGGWWGNVIDQGG